jgi:hypothetical protein
MPQRKKSTRKKAAKKKAPTRRKRDVGGRPPFVPTDEQRMTVHVTVGHGMQYRDVAPLIINPQTGKGISVTTLQKHFAAELASARAFAESRVIASLFKRAVDVKHPQGAACAMFIMKCQFGWRQEDKVTHEHNAGTGVLVAPNVLSPSDWIDQQNAKDAKGKASDE